MRSGVRFPQTSVAGRDAQLKLDFLLKAMNRSALLCRSHPSRQGHSASLQHAYSPNIGTHHFTVDLRGPSKDRRVFRNSIGASLSRKTAHEHH